MNIFILFWFQNSYKNFIISLRSNNKCPEDPGFLYHHQPRFKEVMFQGYDLRNSAFSPFLTRSDLAPRSAVGHVKILV